MRRTSRILAALTAIFLYSPTVLAQESALGSINQQYEAAKAAEIASVKMQLSSQSSAVAVQELNDAENALRRLKRTKGAEQRRKIASQLEMSLTRLHIEADGATRQERP